MRIGLISDIHANLPALQAVLSELGQIDVLLCAGDVVGYYADVNEVCDKLRECGASVIRGNHDAYVLGLLQPDLERVEAYRTAWTKRILTAENRQWLASLPVELVLRSHGCTVRVRHASPWDEESYLYKDSPRLRDIALARDEVLVLGHTHHPMRLVCGKGLVINPGSVGQPRDWSPRASFAILNTESGNVEFRRVSYEVTSLQQRLTELGWDSSMISILSRTR